MYTPTTYDFITTTPALQLARGFFEEEKKSFCYQNALGYSWRCKFFTPNPRSQSSDRSLLRHDKPSKFKK
jgi:hypothetical protein